MIKIISLVGSLLIANICFAQKLPTPTEPVSSDICGTPEPSQKEMEVNFYYGNNDKLKQKYDSLAAIYGNVSSNPNYRNGTYGGEDNIWFRISYIQNK